MTRLILILISVSMLACGTSALVPADNTETHITTNAEQVFTSPPAPKSKATNAPESDFPYQTRVTAETLNIRVGPGHKHELIVPSVWLMKGEQITVYECVGVWGRIGAGRWVNTLYLLKGCEE